MGVAAPVVVAIAEGLYCIVLYCVGFVLHCIALYCVVLYCIVLYCIVLQCIEASPSHSPLSHWHSSMLLQAAFPLSQHHCWDSGRGGHIVHSANALALGCVVDEESCLDEYLF